MLAFEGEDFGQAAEDVFYYFLVYLIVAVNADEAYCIDAVDFGPLEEVGFGSYYSLLVLRTVQI